MNRYFTYCKERFPLVTYLLLCGGIASSACFATAARRSGSAFTVALTGLLLFFFELRLMDELKDYHKDIKAHPERPLPRGLLTVDEARRAVYLLMGAMLLFGVLSGQLLYLISTAYLWLMYKEFYCAKALTKRPLLYATTHQIILIPLAGFAAACYGNEPLPWTWSFLILGGFFTYEICRKLDPDADPILETYPIVCGRGPTTVAALLTLTVAVAAASVLGLYFLFFIHATVALALILWQLKPSSYKLTEAIATLSLLIHLWALTIASFL